MRITNLVLLEGGMTVDAALARIGVWRRPDMVLIRRRTGAGVTWHRFAFDSLKSDLGAADGADRVGQVVTLDALNELPEIDPIATTGPYPTGVLVQHGEVLAVNVADDPPLADERLRSPLPMAEASIDVPADLRPTPPDGLQAPPGFRARGRVLGPPVVLAGEEFAVEIGVVAPSVGAGLDAMLEIGDLADDIESVELDVHLVSGFELVDPAGAVGRLTVERATLKHEPFVVQLRAAPTPEGFDPSDQTWVETVTAVYSHRGRPLGYSWTDVVVDASRTGRAVVPLPDREEIHSTPLALPEVEQPDLIVMITRSGESPISGRYSFVLYSPHWSMPKPPEEVDLGTDTQAFASQLIENIGMHLNDRLSDEVMQGVGETIAQKMPPGFWHALGEVAERIDVTDPSGRAPSVLILTDDTHVPWELALLPEPLDPDRPSYLGAQAVVGRWPLSCHALLASEPLDLSAVAIVVGHYRDPAGEAGRLEAAEKEADELRRTFMMESVNATDQNIDKVLRGELPGKPEPFRFRGIHFAGHGTTDPESGASYITLSNGKSLSDYVFRKPQIAETGDAFLFLNACQVGSAYETLGDYAGVAGKAASAGFRGFVAPLWSVLDETAKEISLRFYHAAVEGLSVAECLRDVRSDFRESQRNANATYLAYVFYGHPSLRLGGPPLRPSASD